MNGKKEDKTAELEAILEERKAYISERDMEVMRVRYGLSDGCVHTLQETAEMFGITAERVHSIERRMLFGHRRFKRVKKIEDFYS